MNIPKTKTVLVVVLVIIVNNVEDVDSLTPDGVSLLSLKWAMEFQPPAEADPSTTSPLSDWNENDSSPCQWTGISCMNISGYDYPRVVGISLSGKYLHGYLPSELGSLLFLRRLNLHNNLLFGPIPLQLFNATSLHSIFLYNNNLSGPLPPSICSIPRLQNLDLSYNSFSGRLPSNLNDCNQLQRLTLSNNFFSSHLPSGVWPALDHLLLLDLSSNSFNGPIPNDLGDLNSLSGTLNLSFNHFSGRIPTSLGNLPVTVGFDFRNNNLSGQIPQLGSIANQGPTAFLGNPLLCGFPLQKGCDVNSNSDDDHDGAHTTNSNDGDNGIGRQNGSNALSPGLIILISVADAAGVAFIGLIMVYLYWKKKDSEGGCSCTGKTKFGAHNNDNLKSPLCSCIGGGIRTEESSEGEEGVVRSSGRGGGGGEGELVAIDKGFSIELDELLRASAYLLGKSGLGIVYKVVLGNGIPVAVRRLGEGGDQQRYREFVAEVQAIGKIKHPNVVKLRAYYWASDEKLLICDFISNGNLANALRGRSSGQASMNLSWSTRLRIAKGTAKGLAYLHECSPRKFVHGAIKPSNILLDTEFQPYISDFGLNRLISITGSNTSTSGGFMGGALPYVKCSQTERNNNYCAPEARIPGSKPTQKWDVYSFGVVLLELVTGKSPELSPSSSMEVPDLVRWVRKGFEEESPLSEMVDPLLLQEVHAKKEVLAVFHVALACTEADPEVRPRMKTVSENLVRIGT